MDKGTVNLTNLGMHFSNEDSARELLEKMRWPNGACCPKCGGADPYRLTPKASGKNKVARRGLWKCSQCRKQFTVTVGTIFEHSKVPMSKWLLAVHLMAASKKGMSAHQLHRMLGVKYQTSWFMAHRLRAAMAQDSVLGMFDGTVEVDETYVGGKERHPNKGTTGRIPQEKKVPVLALVERQGRVRAFPMPMVTHDRLQAAIRERVKLSAHMVTDGHRGYNALSMGFASHNTVNHTAHEYVRGTVHTNTVEGFFGILKRGINGTFHHVGKGHLHRYCDEFAFRYNHRTALGVNDSQRAVAIVQGAEGKRLTYAQPA